MTRPTLQSRVRATPTRRLVSVWVGLALLLFNVLGGSALGDLPTAAIADSQTQICTSSGHHPNVPPGDHHAHLCALCLPLCGDSDALPGTRPASVLILRSWQKLSFASTPVARRGIARRTGFIARAPPDIV